VRFRNARFRLLLGKKSYILLFYEIILFVLRGCLVEKFSNTRAHIIYIFYCALFVFRKTLFNNQREKDIFRERNKHKYCLLYFIFLYFFEQHRTEQLEKIKIKIKRDTKRIFSEK
jgi:hypothetical protein